ncbi:UNVERIFIED_CONTAM: hypothetical protein HDU68_007029 [Siphonaria sp. JEL0065]|nr:hypothetical protein HDU68_007029 [Siphonaria sp. JEL0065]
MQNKNEDLSLPAIQHFNTLQFVSSPTVGVWRGPLDRKGDEVARATTLVRFDPNTKFPYHVHEGGEEFLVLEGTFIDEEGEYPTGSYIRHPIGSDHSPWVGPDGCLILVKLWWMHPDDRLVFVQNAVDVQEGTERQLFQGTHTSEQVFVVSIPPGKALETANSEGGLEVFVLEGEIVFNGESFAKYGWIRLPSGFDEKLNVIQSEKGAKCFVKRNHLK